MAQTITARLEHAKLTARAPARQAAAGVRFWLPDLALVAALVTFLYVLFISNGSGRLFRDSDAGWHIRSGEEILRTLRVPQRDPYSFSRAGQPWMNWEWLADAASGAVHRAAGPAGVAVLFAAMIAAAVWATFHVEHSMGANFLVACALAVPLLGTIQLHWLARPHIWGWIFMLGALAWAEGPRSRGRLALYAAGSALWANIHPSFVFAPALALLYAAGRAAAPLLWDLDRRRERGAAQYYLAAAALSALATFANPYGWRLHQHVARYLGDAELLGSVKEFQSFNFQLAGTWQIQLALGLAAAGTLLALWRGRLEHFLLGTALLALALRSARGLPVVALLVLPIAATHWSELWRRLGEAESIAPALRGWLRRSFAYGERLGDLDRRAGGAVWALPAIAAITWLAAPGLRASAGFPASEFPVEAAARLEQLAPELFAGGGRLLAPDKFGGYLIYRFDGRLKVYFDGRSDFYGREFLKEYGRLAQVRPGWDEIAARYRFTHALLPPDYSLAEALGRAGWAELYRDKTAVLLRRGRQ